MYACVRVVARNRMNSKLKCQFTAEIKRSLHDANGITNNVNDDKFIARRSTSFAYKFNL